MTDEEILAHVRRLEKRLAQPFHPIDAPTEPGWWWYGRDVIRPIRVVVDPWSKQLSGLFDSDTDYADVTECGGQWYGPRICEPNTPH